MKKLIIAAVFVALSTSVFSQEVKTSSTSSVVEQEGTIVVNPFNKNWELVLGAGAQAYLGEYTSSFKVADWWRPTVDLGIRKWTSPFFALGFGFNFAPYKGLYALNDAKAIFAKSGDPLYNPANNNGNLKLAHGSYLNIYADGSADLCNLIGGYKSDRLFHLIASLGGGVIIPTSNANYMSLTATFNAGLRAQFYFSKYWGAYLSVRGALVGDGFNGISYLSSTDTRNIPLDGIIGLTVGASYKFGFVNKNNAGTAAAAAAAVAGKEDMEWVPMTIAMTNTETYKKDIQEAKSEGVKTVEKKVKAANKVVKEQKEEIQTLQAKVKVYESQLAVNKEVMSYRQYVNFKIDKYYISEREKVNIQLAAEVIKANPAYKFTVIGFADKQTATPSYNKVLSRNRAEAVANCLVKEFGVNADQLVVKYEGGVDYMFYNKAHLSRAVLIAVVKE